jgi:hypothetical protein
VHASSEGGEHVVLQTYPVDAGHPPSDPDSTRDASASDRDTAAARDAGTARDAVSSACDAIGSCPARSFGIWRVLLDAADFGPEARLVAVGGQAVLVAIGDGSFRVVRLGMSDDPEVNPPYTVGAAPGGDQLPIAIAHSPQGTDLVYVATCDAARTHCSVWHTASADAAWTEDALPTGAVLRGLVFEGGLSPAVLCAFGNGLWCMGGAAWEEVIAPADDLQLNDAAIAGRWSVAVGEHGRWFSRTTDDSDTTAAWREQPRLGDVSLMQAAATETGAIIVGDDRLVEAIGSYTALLACGIPIDALAAYVPYLGSPKADGIVVSQRGELLQYGSARGAERYCAYQQLTLPSRIIDMSKQACAGSGNPRALTERALFGPPYTCVEVP